MGIPQVICWATCPPHLSPELTPTVHVDVAATDRRASPPVPSAVGFSVAGGLKDRRTNGRTDGGRSHFSRLQQRQINKT